jgi:hypothetical protein
VGGTVNIKGDVSPIEWAFYFVDFYRYMPPVTEGPARSLTVCNVAYRRQDLDCIAPLWRDIFHETAINDALQQHIGPLWLTPRPRVTMRRSVTLWGAIRERYAFGRLFGCTRLDFSGGGSRLYYCLLAPALPFVLFKRMAAKGLRHRTSAPAFARAVPALVLMVLAWSWGEWLGYLTRRRPSSLVASPEILESLAARDEGGARTAAASKRGDS